MQIYKTLESLGFFEWLYDTHNLRDTDMKPEYLDRLSLNDIHITVVNSMAFRWFREKYEIAGEVNNYYSDGKWSYNYDIVTKYKEKASDMFDKHEYAELACLRKLIQIVKKQITL